MPGRALEIVGVFLVAFLIVVAGWRVVGEGAFARQVVVWFANVAMLAAIWIGLRLRGQSWSHFGLRFGWPGWRRVLASLGKSVVVCIVAASAFVLGAIIAPDGASAPAQADMSSYDWLRGNLLMLLFALPAVYVVSSFGEEVVYRGFLITRLAEFGGHGRAVYAIAGLVSALVFGLVHFTWGPVGVIQTTLMGAALAVSYLVLKQQLWILIFAHAYLDTLLLVQLYLGPATDVTP